MSHADDDDPSRNALFGGVRLPEPTGPNRYASSGPAVGQDLDSQKSALFAGFNVEASAKSARVAQMDAEQKAADAKRDEEESEEQGELELDDFSDAKLNLTAEEINFDQIDDDLANFQQDEIVRDALHRGVDLRSYARQIDGDLLAVEVGSIGDYVSQADNIAELYAQMHACEDILETMQQMLQGFQSNLSSISSEIKHLQDRSVEMNIELGNRNEITNKLKLFMERVVVTPDFMNQIYSGDINEAYVLGLRILSDKIAYCTGHGAMILAGSGESADPHEDFGLHPSDTAAGREVIPMLEKLRTKSVQRTREFLMTKIAELKRPKANVQIQQEAVLLKMRYLVQFINTHAQDVAVEITQTYIESMSNILQHTFKQYQTNLAKLQQETPAKTDVIVVEQTGVKLGSLFAGKSETRKMDSMSIGTRANILSEEQSQPILLHVAQGDRQKYPYEVLFRSINRHLMDATLSELRFVIEFFQDAFGLEECHTIFSHIIAKTLSLCLESLENFLFECYDCIGLMLMIFITNQQRLEMHNDNITVLDGYFDRLNMLLWPRFKMVFDLNMMSVRNANARRLGSIELQPHLVTRRYAEFSASVTLLHAKLQTLEMSDEMVVHNLIALRGAFIDLLNRMAEEHSNVKARCVFLINNYDAIVKVHEERKVDPPAYQFYVDSRNERIRVYVEEELSVSFARLITFVKETEARYGTAGATEGESKMPAGVTPHVDLAVAEALVTDFAANWKQGMDKINQSVLKHFSNFQNAAEILKQVLTQLLLYYTRFQDIIKAAFKPPPAFFKQLVPITTIFYEISKYNRAIS